MQAEPARRGTAARGADEEAGEGRQRRSQRETAWSGEPTNTTLPVMLATKTRPQAEDAHRIDDAGERGQHQHERRQRPVGSVGDETAGRRGCRRFGGDRAFHGAA